MDKFPVDLWTVSLTTPSPSNLSDDEIERAQRFRFEGDRVRWTRARSALRLILSRYVGDDPFRIAFEYGPHGKPALPPINYVQFNLSHAGDWAMIAVSGSVPVGVDIERIRPDLDMTPLLERLGETGLPSAVPDLYHVWTRREARVKAAGGALFETPAANISAVDVKAPEGYVGSVALVAFEPEIHYCGNGRR